MLSNRGVMKRISLKKGFRLDYIGIGLLSLGLGSLQFILDKGQREDWFHSDLIRFFFVVMVVGLLSSVLWELRQKEPVVDFRMLKDRNFAVATSAMFLLGFVLYASTVLIPQMVQQLLGYSAELAGLALSPGGLVIMFMMPVVGLLVSKVEARWLVMIGCIVCSGSLFLMSGWNLDVSFGMVVRGRMLQSAGMAFLFIPINVAAFSFLARDKTNMGTGIINLARNIGASIGVATVTTMLERRAQIHNVQLNSHIVAGSPAYENMIAGSKAHFLAVGADPVQAAQQAHGLLYWMVQRQAAMMAFVDNFWLLGLIFLLMIPLLFLMKKALPPKGPLAVH